MYFSNHFCTGKAIFIQRMFSNGALRVNWVQKVPTMFHWWGATNTMDGGRVWTLRTEG
jgi:hypothetical protein